MSDCGCPKCVPAAYNVAPPSPVAKPAPVVEKKTRFTAEEVAAHNTLTDCWVTVHQGVYDVTNYMNKHPGLVVIALTNWQKCARSFMLGGGKIIFRSAGKDITRDFEALFHSKRARVILEKLRVGDLEGASLASAPRPKPAGGFRSLVSVPSVPLFRSSAVPVRRAALPAGAVPITDIVTIPAAGVNVVSPTRTRGLAVPSATAAQLKPMAAAASSDTQSVSKDDSGTASAAASEAEPATSGSSVDTPSAGPNDLAAAVSPAPPAEVKLSSPAESIETHAPVLLTSAPPWQDPGSAESPPPSPSAFETERLRAALTSENVLFSTDD